MTGGGTAGHVTPNIALIPKLKAEGFEIEYIGTSNGIEKELITNESIKYHEISAGKLRRYLDWQNITDIFKIIKGFFQANKHIRKSKPDVVFSKGGFVSCPVVWASWLHRVPVVIHESDITPGLANKLSMPFAKKICYAFPETRKYLPKDKAQFTGIPVRDTITNGSKAKGLSMCNFNTDKPIILVIGGSLGSKYINSLIRDNLDTLLQDYQICHICGKNDMDNSLVNKTGYIQFPYVNEGLSDLFAMADMFISRAGATTLYEILNLAKPNILIPLPKSVSRGDQVLNADFFEKEKYSLVLHEETLTNEQFIDSIDVVIKSSNDYSSSMKKSEVKDSIQGVIDTIQSVKR